MKALQGTRRLVRLALRRDRITVPTTALLSILMVSGSAPALVSAYPGYTEQLSYVASSAPSVVGRLFQGTVQGPNLGTILIAEVFLFAAVIMAIMSILIVTRHTRHNEETGAGELLGSTEVGRSAPLTAALIVAIGATVFTAVIIFVTLAAVPELDKVGSLYLSMALAGIGIFFAGVAAITAQLSDYRRGANGMAIGALAGLFILRGLGDSLGELSADGLSVSASWISWLSPLGWGTQTLPYSGNHSLPILMLLIGFVITSAIGYFLMNRRDIGSGIFQAKPGPARAKQSLLSPLGLAARLQKGNLIGWSAGFIVSGGLIAVVANDFQETFEENEAFQEFLVSSDTGGAFSDTIIATMFPLLAAMLAGYVVGAMSKMYDEEASGRIEYLLGTAMGRIRWMMSHVGFTTIGIFISLGLMGLAGGIGYTSSAETGNTSLFDVVLAGLFSVPAMVTFMSVIALVFALFGRFVKVFAWSYFGYCALIGSLAGIFKWPQWVSNVSPFVHTPAYPSIDTDILPLVILSAVAVLLIALSALLFSRRDISLK